MENYLIPLCAVGIFILLIVIQVIMGSEHPFRSAVFSLMAGPAVLLCINLLQSYTSVSMPVSPLSLSVAAVLGIPGVTAMLIIQRIL